MPKHTGYPTSRRDWADSNDRHAKDKASNSLVARENNLARQWTESVCVTPRRIYDALTPDVGYFNRHEPTRPAIQYNSRTGRYEPADYSQDVQPMKRVAHLVKMSGRRGGSGQQGGSF